MPLPRGLDFGDIGLAAAVALFERGARVARRLALLFGPGERDQRAVAAGEFAGLRAVDVPTGVGAERNRDRRQSDAGDFVAVGVYGAHSRAVDVVDPRRRVDPIKRIFA